MSWSELGIELELAVLLLLVTLGQNLFARFEIETPRARLLIKWFLLYVLTGVVYWLAGHWALLVPLGLGALGLGVHFVWCRRHRIDALSAAPLERYYELRGWRWPPAG